MSKFVPIFRELATFTEVLHTQIELILVERLHHNWLKVMLPHSVTLLILHIMLLGAYAAWCAQSRMVHDY